MSDERRFAIVLVVIALFFCGVVAADSIIEAVKDGDISADVRYRYEDVDEAGFDEDAEASTRTRRLFSSGSCGTLP